MECPSLVYVDECRCDEIPMEVTMKHYQRAHSLPVPATAPASAPHQSKEQCSLAPECNYPK